MPMDGITLGAVCAELTRELAGGKIDKIQQPERDLLLISVRAGGKTKKLMLTLGNNPRLHITSRNFDNPQIAPAFCMLMRKHLSGGRIEHITQMGNERVVFIDALVSNEMGDLVKKRIAAEIMGKYSNIILLDGQNTIIDALRRVTPDISRLRCVLPHEAYQAPPSQGKLEPTAQNIAEFLRDNPQPTPGRIFSAFTGISKAAAEEMCALGPDGPAKYMQKVYAKDYSPTLVCIDGEPRDYLPFPYITAGPQEARPSFSGMLDEFYGTRDMLAHAKARSKELRDMINSLLERCEKKRGIYSQKLLECRDMETLRVYGELLTANLHAIKRGSKSAEVINYYDPDSATVTIPLDDSISPQANAQKYFKQYAKLKTASRMLDEQISQNNAEIVYLESLAVSLESCTTPEQLDEVRRELIEQGYLRAPKKPVKQAVSVPMRFLSPDGTEILVGRNNIQNDTLSLRTARPDELWLHVKNAAGSHVIIRSAAPSEKTIETAACLAAYYSKARLSSNVAVDAALAKNVKKPRGAKPGMVIYEDYTTYFVTPDEKLIKQLLTSAG